MLLICRPSTFLLVISLVMCRCHLYTAQPESCHDAVDIVFVIDQSESIAENDPPGSPGHGWKAIMDFLSQLIDSFVVGPTYARIALVKYSSQPVVIWHLDHYDNAADVKQAIARLQHEGGNTNTAEALGLVRREVLTANSNRGSARDVVVILTDGLSTQGFKELPLQALLLRGTGAEVFVIAVGKETDEAELRSMVKDFSRDIVHVEELPALPYIESLIIHRLCRNPGPLPTLPPSNDCTPPIDLAFIIDNSGSIGLKNYVILKDFLIQLTKQLEVTTRHKIAMVRFSDLTDIEFGLGQYQDRNDLDNIITKAPFRDKETNTAAGLRTTTNHVFGSSGDRPRVRNAALLIADGESNRDVRNTQPEAVRAKLAGIELFVIGITDKINYQELQGIASDPDDEHFYDATDVQYLAPLIPRLIKAMCHS